MFSYSAELSKVSVSVRSSYICAICGNSLEISNIVIHEDFNKWVYFNDIALIKVCIFNRWANIQHIYVIGLSCIWHCYRDKLVTFIILVAKESRRVRRKVASYRAPREGEWTSQGWNTLCRYWLETGKYQVTRAILIYF